MTKYIMQSGGLVNQPERAKNYYKEIFSAFDKNTETKMLWCFFASIDYGEADLFKKWFHLLGGFIPDEYQVTHTTATVEGFSEQVHNSDIIYLHGGSTQKFLSRVREHDLRELLTGKVVCTNSASTIALSVASYDAEERRVIDGLGILPCKTLVHFNRDSYGADHVEGAVDWEMAKNLVDSYGDHSLPVYALEEGEFIVFNV